MSVVPKCLLFSSLWSKPTCNLYTLWDIPTENKTWSISKCILWIFGMKICGGVLSNCICRISQESRCKNRSAFPEHDFFVSLLLLPRHVPNALETMNNSTRKTVEKIAIKPANYCMVSLVNCKDGGHTEIKNRRNCRSFTSSRVADCLFHCTCAWPSRSILSLAHSSLHFSVFLRWFLLLIGISIFLYFVAVQLLPILSVNSQ